MCGIIGIFNSKEAIKKTKTGLRILKNRGSNGFGIATEKEITTSATLDKLKILKIKKQQQCSRSFPPRNSQSSKTADNRRKQDKRIRTNKTKKDSNKKSKTRTKKYKFEGWNRKRK